MSKKIAICRLQVIGCIVILATIIVAIVSGARYSSPNLGLVLGASAPPSSTQVVATTLTDGVVSQVQSGYGIAIFGVVMLAGAVMIYQLMMIIKKLGTDKQFGLANILQIGVIDIVIFVLTVISIASFNTWSIKRESPQNLHYERVSSELVRVTWESRSNTMSQVLWGYDPDHLDNINLGVAGENKVQVHEVMFNVNVGGDIYFKIVVNGIKYGDSGTSGYYRLTSNNQINKLYELKLKEKP